MNKHIGIGCLDDQFKMNLQAFEFDQIPCSRFNITPFMCSTATECFEEFKKRRDRILCKYHPFGKPVCISLEQYFFWDGDSLDDVGELILFKCRDDAQKFLEKHFEEWCDKCRGFMKQFTDADVDYYWNVQVDTFIFLTAYYAILKDDEKKIQLDKEISQLDKTIREKYKSHWCNTFPDVVVNNSVLSAMYPPTKPAKWWKK